MKVVRNTLESVKFTFPIMAFSVLVAVWHNAKAINYTTPQQALAGGVAAGTTGSTSSTLCLNFGDNSADIHK